MANDSEYSKLDYPVLNCPMKMPGFSNYDPNHKPKEIKERKELIEEIDPEQLKFVQVTIGQNKHTEQMMDQVNKIIKNS